MVNLKQQVYNSTSFQAFGGTEVNNWAVLSDCHKRAGQQSYQAKYNLMEILSGEIIMQRNRALAKNSM